MTKDLMDSTELNTMDERSRDEYFMSLAIEEGKKAYALGEIPIGAILVHNNQVISRHHNRRELDHDATAHAEVLVIREACNSLKSLAVDWMHPVCYDRAVSYVRRGHY